MPAPPIDARSQSARVVSVVPCGADGVLLRIAPKEPVAPMRAGRFFMLRCVDGTSPPIPRPFSVYRQHGDGSLEFMIKVMGRGTRALAGAVPGKDLTCIGPLGNGWPELGPGAPWVMLAGGIGSAPFHMAIEQALAGTHGAQLDPSDLTLIYGGRHQGFLYDLESFMDLGVRILATTDDGSAGYHGNVVDCLRNQWATDSLPESLRLFTCGPEPMMRAVVEESKARDLACWYSLETYMGCGVGICNGCALSTCKSGPLADWPVAKACVDGPVFRVGTVEL